MCVQYSFYPPSIGCPVIASRSCGAAIPKKDSYFGGRHVRPGRPRDDNNKYRETQYIFPYPPLF